MEFSAGVGGQEAMLFCADLLKMYCNHCDAKGFEYTLTQFEKSDLEGIRHASINIDHPGNANKYSLFYMIYLLL